jgi:hypothetical protein
MSAGSTTISLLTVAGNDTAPAEILIDRGGFWRGPILMDNVLGPGDDRKNEIERQLNETMVEVAKMIDAGTPQNAKDALAANMIDQYRLLVPAGVQDALTATATAAQATGQTPRLLIHAQSLTEWIPWEILHDGEEFLGLRFQVSRLPIVPQGPEILENTHPVKCVYNLLGQHALERIADVVDPPTFQMWTETFGTIAGAGVTMKQYPAQVAPAGNGTELGYPEIKELKAAAKEADIIHLTCHGGLRVANSPESYWTLNHRKDSPLAHRVNGVITRSMELRKARPLVFANACAFVAGEAEQLGLRGGLTPTHASLLFDFGALAFVGTFAPVVKSTALSFAARFYKHLLGTGGAEGAPIGKALWSTKREFHAEAGDSFSDPSWLFYCLYGSPDLTFKIAE